MVGFGLEENRQQEQSLEVGRYVFFVRYGKEGVRAGGES